MPAYPIACSIRAGAFIFGGGEHVRQGGVLERVCVLSIVGYLKSDNFSKFSVAYGALGPYLHTSFYFFIVCHVLWHHVSNMVFFLTRVAGWLRLAFLLENIALYLPVTTQWSPN